MSYKNKEDDLAWRLKNKTKLKEYHKDYTEINRKKLREQGRIKHVKRFYNLDAETYLKMIIEQNNVCAICFKAETTKNRDGDVRPLCVDHNHITGEVRALLCNKCNALLGHAQDDVTILENSIKYLSKYSGD